MKINFYRGDWTDVSAKTEPLVRSSVCSPVCADRERKSVDIKCVLTTLAMKLKSAGSSPIKHTTGKSPSVACGCVGAYTLIVICATWPSTFQWSSRKLQNNGWRMKPSVLPFKPKYRLGHPKNYLFSLLKKYFLDQSIQKIFYFIFEKGSTGNHMPALSQSSVISL